MQRFVSPQLRTDTVTFRVRRYARPQRHRFTVAIVDRDGAERIGGAETLREAIEVALTHMGPGDTLDVQATI